MAAQPAPIAAALVVPPIHVHVGGEGKRKYVQEPESNELGGLAEFIEYKKFRKMMDGSPMTSGGHVPPTMQAPAPAQHPTVVRARDLLAKECQQLRVESKDFRVELKEARREVGHWKEQLRQAEGRGGSRQSGTQSTAQ